MHHFYTELRYQKPMAKQIKWWLQNGPLDKWITKNRVFPVTTFFFFWKFCFSLTTSYKELICCTNNPSVHICTFCKRWSFIWRCFFPVSIFKASRHACLVCNLFETFSFLFLFFCNPFVLLLPFWVTNLNASNFSCEIILKRQQKN